MDKARKTKGEAPKYHYIVDMTTNRRTKVMGQKPQEARPARTLRQDLEAFTCSQDSSLSRVVATQKRNQRIRDAGVPPSTPPPIIHNVSDLI